MLYILNVVYAYLSTFQPGSEVAKTSTPGSIFLVDTQVAPLWLNFHNNIVLDTEDILIVLIAHYTFLVHTEKGLTHQLKKNNLLEFHIELVLLHFHYKRIHSSNPPSVAPVLNL